MSVDGDVIPREELSVLTPVQQRAFEEIKREWDRAAPRPVLIHGITGSGKTQVYMKLIQTVAEKRTAGDRSDSGDCSYLSDSKKILRMVWRKKSLY